MSANKETTKELNANQSDDYEFDGCALVSLGVTLFLLTGLAVSIVSLPDMVKKLFSMEDRMIMWSVLPLASFCYLMWIGLLATGCFAWCRGFFREILRMISGVKSEEQSDMTS